MNDKEFIAYAKEHPETVLQELYPDRLTAFYQNHNMKCIKPQNHKHGDRNPSMSFNKTNNTFHCFVCGFNYDSLDIIAEANNLDIKKDFPEVLQRARNIYNAPADDKHIKPNIRPATHKQPQQTAKKEERNKNMNIEKLNDNSILEYILKVNKNLEQPEAIAYLNKRTISKTTADKYKLGYDSKCTLFYPPQPALIIPTTPRSYVARNISEEPEENNRYRKKGNANIFNLKGLKEADNNTPVFITEGEIDSLTYLCINCLSVALGSTSNKNLLIKAVKGLPDNRKFILALDNDTAGKEAARYLEEELTKLGHITTKATFKGNDPNEAFTTNPLEFSKSAKADLEYINEILTAKEEQAKEEYYKKHAATNSIETFLNVRENNQKGEFIKTGFRQLDNLFYNGLHNEFYILGAASSTGKTTFIHQIADNIAAQGQHVLIFSLENGKLDLIAKSISRLTYLHEIEAGRTGNYASTTQQLFYGVAESQTQDETRTDTIKEAIEEYKKFSDNIFIYTQNGLIKIEDIATATKEHIKATGKKPVIIVDYLQIVGTKENKAEKEKYDYIVAGLVNLSKSYNLPVICISSFNRTSVTANQNQQKEYELQSFLGSSNIEYTADTVLTMTEKKEEVFKEHEENRIIEIRIKKHRNGPINHKPVTFEYNPKYNYFKELEPEYIEE